ncbi:MAG: hypothetical protein ROZ09_11500 [Thiobacillus sp.]|jgi:GH24 family phage-related lysozyme (muramidase)|uniref:glycoside hydrolase family protein n=1 Tax=Thiobacillus sp. TaxID=924 RepID=UPI002896044A|nr:hypothetical protein [Thiobacillus sp.]MDT3707444.1 hypothetical protein [Thiobacillus sp.]
MRVSLALTHYLKRRCLFADVPYIGADGLRRIGYGHVIRRHEDAALQQIPEPQADFLLQADCHPIGLYLDAIQGRFAQPLTQQQFDALAALCFRVGLKPFETSAMPRQLRAGDIDAVSAEFASFDWLDDHHTRHTLRRSSRHAANCAAMEREIFDNGRYA